MSFSELKEGLKDVLFDEARKDTDNYFEAVILSPQLKELTDRLKNFFGLPVYPSESKLSSQAEKAIEEFGGVMSGQTLYYWNKGNDVVFAMLWPWQDGEHITLKIAHKSL